MQRDPTVDQRPPEHFIERIVAAHVFSETDQIPLRIEQSGRMTAPGSLEQRLPGFHQVGKSEQESAAHTKGGQVRDVLSIGVVDLEGLDGSLPTDPATGRGIEIPLHRGGIHRHGGV